MLLIPIGLYKDDLSWSSAMLVNEEAWGRGYTRVLFKGFTNDAEFLDPSNECMMHGSNLPGSSRMATP